MRTAKIRFLQKLENLPDQDRGDQPVILVKTDWDRDKQNSFYMDRVDTDGNAITIPTTSEGSPNDPDCLNWDDEISYDKTRFPRKIVIWRGRRFIQRGYSFDGR